MTTVLVAYASKHGSTAEIAAAVAQTLNDHPVFGGSLAVDAHGIAGAMARGTPAQYLDRRDWDEIRAWAEGIAAMLRVPAEA